uniref:Uncharacterized protein n=1 Tax=Glossina brevipalpis TaxID=37001 RepID=A0A1A9X2I5_9MUSC
MSKVKANFVSSNLNLPLFLVSRNKIKDEQLVNVKSLIKKQSRRYTKNCKSDNDMENETHLQRKHRNSVGDYKKKEELLNECIDRKSSRSTTGHFFQENQIRLPPNLYDVVKKPFLSRKGMNGAYISRIGRKTFQVPTGVAPNEYNTLISLKDKLNNKCNSYKGVFLESSRIPSTRTMVSSLVTCKKNPKEPGPCSYKGIISKKTPPTKQRVTPNPHQFYRNSIIPVKKNVIHKRHTSFTPGPGRYETRYWKICPCPSHKIYKPNLYLLVDHEKRRKYMQQPYNKIRINKYCCPDWRHVIGGGYQRLFRGVIKREQRRDRNPRRMPQISKWVHMINSIPARVNTRLELPEKPTKVTYNTIIKLIMRRQIASNRRVAFGSGASRFAVRKKSRKTTLSLLNQPIVQKPSVNRKKINFSITSKPLFLIDSKYKEPSKRLIPPCTQVSRKRQFKFLALPAPKLLVSDEEINNGQKFPNLYHQPVDPIKYMVDTDQLTPEKANEIREFASEVVCFGSEANSYQLSLRKLNAMRSNISSLFS